MPAFQTVQLITQLLVIAIVVGLVSKRLRAPYTVALVLVGTVLGFTHFIEVPLSTELILFVFLPPLLFEGTLAMDLGLLRQRWKEVALLALPVTLLTVGIVGAAAHWGLGFSWQISLLLGAIVAPTDPVSVLALLRELGVARELSIIVEGESCFNDGVGVVLFLIISEWAAGGELGVAEAGALFMQEAVGGLLIGTAAGILVQRLLKRIDDHLIEVMISIALAFGSYILATNLHASGVMAVVAAGLVIGNYARLHAMSPTTRVAVSVSWEMLAFIANSLLFLLMGLSIQGEHLLSHAGPILLIFVALLLSRVALTYATTGLAGALRSPMPRSWPPLIAWSGVRGSIPIALALGVEGAARSQVLAITFGVVLLSLLLQGLTIKPLLYRLGLVGKSEHEEQLDERVARRIAVIAALSRLGDLNRGGHLPPTVHSHLNQVLEDRLQEVQRTTQELLADHPELEARQMAQVERALALAERAAVEEALQKGLVGEHGYARIIDEVNARLDVLPSEIGGKA